MLGLSCSATGASRNLLLRTYTYSVCCVSPEQLIDHTSDIRRTFMQINTGNSGLRSSIF
ncbi:hypothetical protein PUN28_010959 [Cardiocondyla obscurior]|uniref:Uncharacterized protein n=1 Tax=Cardiocondyla obscurior TaxID=286306 RepID=A0AAW2FLX5_9HYME